MFEVSIRDLAYTIVNHELKNNNKEGMGLHLHFDVSMATHPISERRGLHLIYQVNPGYSYISVFSAVSDNPFTDAKKIQNWTHEATHDSEWRSINALNNLYFELASLVNERRVAKGEAEVPPVQMHQYSTFAKNKLFEWIPVSVQTDPDDENNYRKILTIL